MIRVKKAVILLSALFMVSHQARALSPDQVREVGFPGEPFDVSIDESSGDLIVWTIEANEVVTYDEDGNKLADCTAPLGLGNFNRDRFDETSVPSDGSNDGTPYSDFNYTGSRVTRVSGSVASMVNTDIPQFFAIDCNNPGAVLDFGALEPRYALSSSIALGMDGGLDAARYNYGQVGVFNDVDPWFHHWTPVVASSPYWIAGGFKFDSSRNIYRPSLHGEFIGDNEGQVTHISESPLSSNTVIFTDGGVTRYRVWPETTGPWPQEAGLVEISSFQGFDIVDISPTAFLISESSRCLLVEGIGDVTGSSSVGANCSALESSGSLIYVIADGLLRVFDTNPVAIDSSIGCDYSNADVFDGWGWNPDTMQSCAPLGTENTSSPIVQTAGSCDYSDAARFGGWGWNETTRESCAPLMDSSEIVEQEAATSPAGCNYSNAALSGGWGWNETTRESCAPLSDSSEPVEQVTAEVPTGCDYSNAALSGGWGWNETTRESCAPLSDSSEPVEQVTAEVPTGCDYSNAALSGGWGWNEATRESCSPL